LPWLKLLTGTVLILSKKTKLLNDYSKYDIGKAISILKPVFESKRLGLADKWSLNANQKRDTYLDYVGKVTITTELDEDEIMEVALELDVSDVKDRDCAFEFIVPARGMKKLNFHDH